MVHAITSASASSKASMEHRDQPERKNAPPLEAPWLACRASAHCIAGCAIGTGAGLVIANSEGWALTPSIVFSVSLAFAFGYVLTMLALLRAGVGFLPAAGMVIAANTPALTVMQIVATTIMVLIPGALAAALDSLLFLSSLSLALASGAAYGFPLNAWMIFRRVSKTATRPRPG